MPGGGRAALTELPQRRAGLCLGTEPPSPDGLSLLRAPCGAELPERLDRGTRGVLWKHRGAGDGCCLGNGGKVPKENKVGVLPALQ